ncbi:MAG: hypothetical protein ACTSQE_14160 [Candidatus Heimdallarchaeaceae archaeon]
MNIKNKKILYGAIILFVLTSAAIGVYFGVIYSPDTTDDQQEEGEKIIFSLVSQSTSVNYTLSELKDLPSVTGYGGYKRTTGSLEGPHQYTGVPLLTLLNAVGGISQTDDIQITSSDGYMVTFSYEMVEGHVTAYDSKTGDYVGIGDFQVILAYEQDGAALYPDSGPLRIALISSSSYLSDGHLWSKMVEKIEIVSATATWTVYLYGVKNDSIDRAAFESAMSCGSAPHRQIYEVQEGDRNHTYEGLPLWIIVAIVDGGETEAEPHYVFNDDLAAQGYNITLVNYNGESITLTSQQMARNDDIILAAKKDSLFLNEYEAPLKLVGSDVATEQIIFGITEIWLILP